ncbi:MAG: 2-oxoacid:acceptor oxidoreductase family protein [Desulfomonilaceae bacterium]
MLEIKFNGRGGQGVVVASQILGFAFFKGGHYPQCYSVFGGERRGAPVVSFLRVDEKKILLKCEIKHPGELIYMDDSMVEPEEIRKLLLPGGRILINTRRPADDFSELQGFDLGLVDALSISSRVGLGGIINTTILSAYCRFTGTPPLSFLKEAISEMVPARVTENLEAVELAYESVMTRPPRS